MAYTPQTFFKGAKTMVAKTPAMAVQLAYDGWTLSGPAPAPPRSQRNASLADLDDATAVTAQAYGASGNGSADDTSALQAALNAAVAAGRPLEVKGRLRTTGPIVLPTGKAITIRAAGRDVNPWGPLSDGIAAIESSGAAVFTAADGGPVKLNLQGVNFRNTNGGISAAVFKDIAFSESTIHDITAGNYNRIISGGTFSGVSRVVGSRFLSVKTAFCSAQVVDSEFSHNYISGSVNTNASVFTGGWANSSLSDNYIDFFKRVFDCPGGDMAGIRVHDNIFDYVFCTIGTSTGAFLTQFAISGNTWTHCKASEALGSFSAPDAEMTGTTWRAIDASAGMNRSTINGNQFLSVDVALRFESGIGTITESGNVYVDCIPISFNPSYFTADPPNVRMAVLGSASAITAAPLHVGQTAVVGGVGYLATGTSAPSDWKQITN